MIKLTDIVKEIKITPPRISGVLRVTVDNNRDYITKDNPYFADNYIITKLTDSLFYLGIAERSPFIEDLFKKSNIPFTIQPSPETGGIRYIISSENIEII